MNIILEVIVVLVCLGIMAYAVVKLINNSNQTPKTKTKQ